MITREQLAQLKSVDLRTVNKATLVDIRSVSVDASAMAAERARQFIKQVGNPYLFRVGDSAIKLSFGDGKNKRAALKDYLLYIRAGD